MKNKYVFTQIVVTRSIVTVGAASKFVTNNRNTISNSGRSRFVPPRQQIGSHRVYPLYDIQNSSSLCYHLDLSPETTSSVTVAKKGSHKQTLEVILRHLAEAVSRNHLVLSDMSFVRVCVPRFGFLEANNTQGNLFSFSLHDTVHVCIWLP